MKGKKVKKHFVSSKRGIVVKGEWKAVNVDPTLFSEEGLEGLVCFEELTDYSLVEADKTISAKTSVKKTGKDRKRKSSEVEGQPQHDDTEDKPDNKKKRNNFHQDEMVEQHVDDDISLEDCPEDLTPETSSTVSKKKDRKKQRKKKTSASEVKGSHVQTEVSAVITQPKKKTKNWTNVAHADKEGQNADVSAWKDLFVPAAVLKALSKLGFSAPTPIQALAIPPAIRDRLDVLGAAETGSGKTLCFGIPMIHTVLEWRTESKHELSQKSEVHAVNISIPADSETDTSRARGDDDDDDDEESSRCCTANAEVCDETAGTDSAASDEAHETAAVTGTAQKRPLLCLVLTPTRELAVQVKHHIDAVAQFTGVKTAVVVGGMAPQKQQRMLMRRPEIVIATPGRLWEMIKERNPHLLNLRQLRCLVIDEADRMVEKGHFSELENLLEMLNTSQFNPRRQTFVFSATLTVVHSLPLRLQQKKGRKTEQRSKLQLLMEKVGIKDKPKIIDLTRKEATVETLTETRINCTKEEKDFYLYYFLLQYRGRTMVFANSIDCIKRLNALLQILDCSPLPLHANMHQKQRLKNLEKFAEKESCVLLTTDVAARGLDIPNVQHVIHYQVPRTSETYVHRSGRTARATKEGLSLLLIGPDDMINFRKICRTLEKDEDLPVFPVQSSCMTAIEERVNLARKIEKMEYFHSREKQHNSWIRQAADAMDIDVDEDLLLGAGKGEDENRQQQKFVKLMKKQLKLLISQPVFRNQIKTKYPTQMGKLHLPQTSISTVALTCVKHTR